MDFETLFPAALLCFVVVGLPAWILISSAHRRRARLYGQRRRTGPGNH